MTELKPPLPAPTPVTAPFWEAAQEQVLAIQRCRDCGLFSHPPWPHCPSCLSLNREFTPVSGLGSIYQRVVVHESRTGGFDALVPYVAAAVELDEQPGLLVTGNILGVEPHEAEIGMRVRVEFEDRSGYWLPQFRRDTSAEKA